MPRKQSSKFMDSLRDLISRIPVSTKTHYSGENAYRIVNMFLDLMIDAVINGYDFKVSFIGTFYIAKVRVKNRHIPIVTSNGRSFRYKKSDYSYQLRLKDEHHHIKAGSYKFTLPKKIYNRAVLASEHQGINYTMIK